MTTLRTRDDIQALLFNRRQLHSWAPLQLRLDFLDTDAQASLETRLNKWKSECGCSYGAIALWAGMGLLLVWSWGLGFPFPGNWLIKAGSTVLWVFASAVSGKLTGIWLARRRMKHALRQLLQPGISF